MMTRWKLFSHASHVSLRSCKQIMRSDWCTMMSQYFPFSNKTKSRLVSTSCSHQESHELMLNLAKEDKLFSIIELSGKQYKVTLQDTITCHRLNGVQVGQLIPLDRVLLVGSRHYTLIGQPYITTDYFRLFATVIEQGKGPKMFIERFKRRKNYDRRIGHRQHTTTLKISAYEVGAKKEEEETRRNFSPPTTLPSEPSLE